MSNHKPKQRYPKAMLDAAKAIREELKRRGRDKDVKVVVWGEAEGQPEPTLHCIAPIACQAAVALEAANAAAEAVGLKVRFGKRAAIKKKRL